MRLAWIALLAAACGGSSYCERSAKLAEDCGESISDEDLAECEEMLEPCSKDDEKLLEDSLDCMEENGLFACEDTSEMTTDEAMEMLGAVFACALPLAGVSEECGLGFEMTFTSTPTGGT